MPNVIYAILVFMLAQLAMDLVFLSMYRRVKKEQDAESDALFRLAKNGGKMSLDLEELKTAFTDDVKEVLKEQARTEKAFADGVQSILGYSITDALKKKEGE